ncbi:TIGR03767 family metallophosphoesterase [Gryllotalpicola protaetiae]|uniref:TIGR03767 family metallophosphoesterase n=1 Tax=Gryllotalpicola protaetiae TaxID=2419771 RepID=A0A387BR02_9MICO|nr:TIGR03767 family metallophosphoesterase [Gryllotalpicola protaetiae]AYG04992.1 TIGR03767 family metallophosphoesterase [Gryllotalpicola protaetiae]
MQKVSRRTALIGGAGVLALAPTALAVGLAPRRFAAALVPAAHRPLETRGTTLESAAAPQGNGPYRRLTAGPGYAPVLREDLASRASATPSLIPLAAVVQLTDLHIVDAQSPARFEMFSAANGSAFRPQEALGTHGAARLIARINAIGAAPFTGRALDAVVSTGDNTDNGETLELDWYLAALSGGQVVANSGSRTLWEGAQSSGRPQWYNPESPVADVYKKAGFPELPGFFGRVAAPHTSAGLAVPWYAVFGNHDDSVCGSLSNLHSAWDDVYTGDVKFTRFTTDAANAAVHTLWTTSATTAAARGAVRELGELPALDRQWEVTADERRRPFSKAEYIGTHLAPENTGPGPVGHGFTADDLAAGRTYYTAQLAPGVLGVSLDSTTPAGLAHGSLTDQQFRWLEQTLAAHPDEYIVVFSHHTSTSMDNPLPDPDDPASPCHSGDEVRNVLHRHPQVVAWVNGHVHANRITPQRGSDALHSFWEITTASHIDFPQQARIIELARSGRGLLSIFTTLIESDAPYQAGYSDGSQTALASLYRELSFNDPHRAPGHEGEPTDRNTELLLADPLGSAL